MCCGIVDGVMKLWRSLLFLALLPAAMAASADYPYPGYPVTPLDIPLATVLDPDPATFTAWQATATTKIKAGMAQGAGTLWSAGNLTNSSPLPLNSFLAKTVSFPSGPTLGIGIRTPAVIDPDKPVIYVLSAWGRVLVETIGAAFQADGYIVVECPYETWYKTNVYGGLPATYGYTQLFARSCFRVIEAIEPVLGAHTGNAIVSTATGSLVAPFLAVWLRDAGKTPRSMVANGVLLSLDWLRHWNPTGSPVPLFWDINRSNFGTNGFETIWAAIAPIPTQFQMSPQDAFYPGWGPIPPYNGLSGTARGTMTIEVYGMFAMLRDLWAKLGSSDMVLAPPASNGHLEPDYPAALSFVQAH